MGSAAEILLAELRTKLDGQTATLESLRTRAAVILSASGVIAGFLVPHFGKDVGDWTLAALAALIAGDIPAIAIIFPHKMKTSPEGNDWIEFAGDNEAWVATQARLRQRPRLLRRVRKWKLEADATLELGAAQLAVQMVTSMNKWYKDNEPTLACLHRAMVAAAIGLVVQIFCWAGAAISIH